MDPTTFGGSEAAIILIDILNQLNEPKLNRRVSQFLNESSNGFVALASMTDNRWFKRFSILWRKERLALIERHPFHPSVDSYVRNVLVTCGKEWVRGVQ